MQLIDHPMGGTGGNGQVVVTHHTVPTISSISPTNVHINTGEFVITVTGTNFFDGVGYITWNGNDLPTTYVSSKELKATVSDTFISSRASYASNSIIPSAFNTISNKFKICSIMLG